jgi:hypothetical protein
MGVQNCQGGDKLAPCHIEISTETLHSQRKTKQNDVAKVTIMAENVLKHMTI